MPSFTNEDINRGYKVCEECRKSIHLLQAGYDIRQFKCQQCYSWVCDKAEFEDGNVGCEILVK